MLERRKRRLRRERKESQNQVPEHPYR